MTSPHVAVRLARLAVLIVGIGLGGVLEVWAMGARDGASSALTVRAVAAGGHASVASGPTAWLARSAGELERTTASRLPGFVMPSEPTQPAIDWSREVVVGVASGERPTGGYSIEIVSAARHGRTLEVTVREKRPDPGTMTIQVLTTPWALAAVAVDGEVDQVIVRDEKGRELRPSEPTRGGPAVR
ncbi:MAG: protease complex subunit PrcB family protein [Deltaproteobacteria bacterium]|nr:protease complex subunit PrcB family protein [Deltaproteobacteria bacterium]